MFIYASIQVPFKVYRLEIVWWWEERFALFVMDHSIAEYADLSIVLILNANPSLPYFLFIFSYLE